MPKTGIAILAASLSLPLAASQPLAQPPTFRSATDIVEVDVVVQDKSGQFVADLTPADFEIREEGDAQKIDLFYLLRGNSIATPAEAGAARMDFTPPGIARTPRIFVVFFDDEHLTPGALKRAQAAGLTLFSRHFKDGDVGGVVVRGTMTNNRLTTVREELLKSVRDAKTSGKSNSRVVDEQSWPRINEVESTRIIVNNDDLVFSAVYQRACAEEVDACEKIDVRSLIREKARMTTDNARIATEATLRGLNGLMNGLARMEGRKTVLLLSEGFLAEDSSALVQQTIRLAAGANARLYTLDARGLDRQRMGDRLSGPDPGNEDALARLFNQLDMGADSMNSLAVDTGGFVVRNQNAFDAAVAQIAADAGTYYVLGYRPRNPSDGKFRRLSVTVKRPGVVARARRGYLATPKPAPTPSSPVQTESPPEAARNEPAPIKAHRIEATGAAAPVVLPRVRPDATRHIETLAPTRTDEADPDAAAGWAAYQRGDLESASASLGRAAGRSTAHPWVFYALGQSQYALRQYSEAASAWERVRSTTPEFKPVYFDLVDAYLQLKDYDKATRVLRDGEKRFRRDSELFNALGVVQVARGALDDAVHSFEEAVASAPDDAVAYFNLAKACELRYWKYRRFVSQTRQWIANGTDRNKAIDNYNRYLAIGGPLENAAREGLTRLNWSNR